MKQIYFFSKFLRLFSILCLFLSSGVYAQYPTPPYHPNTIEPALYPAPSTPFTYSDWITNVTFAGINNTTANVLWRNNYSATTHASVQRGQTYTLSVAVNSAGADFSFQYIAAYFDWNNNGDCGGKSPTHGGTGQIAGESYVLGQGAGHSNPLTLNITIPGDAAIGTTWLRVYLKADGLPAVDGYLGYFGYGEIEEYAIDISAGNNAPTDITLSASSINENVAANSTVGTLSSTDPDAGNTFTYTLVAGTGSTDNASFNISGSSLRITNSPDFETKSSYSVRVRTTDQGSLYYEKAFTITINDVNEAPSDISLSASSINENVVANSTIGTFSSTDPDAANTFTYTLVAGTGSTDNASFNISGNSLRITNSPNFETKSSYSVRIRTTDQGSLYYEKAFTITINDVNEAPTDIALSASSINENVVANSTIGTLSSTDPDAANTFTYTLVAGTGSTDNTSFNISGSSLRITSSPDYETKSSYSVRVRSTDQGSLYYEKAFTITINGVNEAPTNISLSASSINENVIANSTVGTFSSTDPDAGNTFTYTLVAGTGSTDNASFNISGSSLRITSSPDYETKSSYSVRVRTTDQGSLTFEKVFTITINDVNENVAPVVTTQAVTNITGTEATGNGNITSLGVPNPIQYGVVWSTSTNPTITLPTLTEQGAIAVTGAFTSSITGLLVNTQYYVKAYATNSTGTSYGDEVTFTTLLTDVVNSAMTSVEIYPNPTTEAVNISTGNTSDNGLYSILSPSGTMLANGVITNGEARVTLEKFTSGIYILQIQVGIKKASFKIVKR